MKTCYRSQVQLNPREGSRPNHRSSSLQTAVLGIRAASAVDEEYVAAHIVVVVHVGDLEECVQPATGDPEGSIQSRIEEMDGRIILGEGIVEFDGEVTAAVCSGTQMQESVCVRPACPILPGHVQLPF